MAGAWRPGSRCPWAGTQPFNPTIGTSAGNGTYWLGNYQGVTAAPDGFHPIWTDTRTGSTQIFTATVPG